jgi:hypothetical protein
VGGFEIRNRGVRDPSPPPLWDFFFFFFCFKESEKRVNEDNRGGIEGLSCRGAFVLFFCFGWGGGFLLGGRAQGPSSVMALLIMQPKFTNLPLTICLMNHHIQRGLKLMVIFNFFLALNSIISYHIYP